MEARSVLLGTVALVALACGSGEMREAADEARIERALEIYLPLLAEAYADGDVERLRPYTAEKELARIAGLVEELAMRGSYLRPTFHEVTLEEVRIWNNSNAFVSTLEVWDIRQLAIGTDELIAEDLGKASRVKYQLRRDGASWRVLHRALQE